MTNYIRKISKQRNGARFYKVDMHVHTPSSKDQHYLNEKNKDAFGFLEKKDLIKLFEKQGDLTLK